MELEQKVEVIQGEMHLLKGEVKQILVDLREFVMAERGPFAELGRPAAASGSRNGAASMNREHVVPARAEPDIDVPAAANDGDRAESPRVLLEEAPAKEAHMPEVSSGNPERDPAQAGSEPDPRHESDGSPQPMNQRSLSGSVRQVTRSAGWHPYAPAMLHQDGALDANLVANVIRWVSAVKVRVGGEQLSGLLGVYKLTGHLPGSIEKLILQVAELISVPTSDDRDSTPDDKDFTPDNLMDFLVQLHGIVYGPGHAIGDPPGVDFAQGEGGSGG